MSVSPPNLSITLAVQSACSGLELTDTTGLYNVSTNPFGYGLPGGPDVNDVTGLTVKLTYNYLNTYVLYAFELSSGTITSAELSLNGATAVDILANLPSTDWPFTDPFVLTTSDYGVTMPSFADDIFKVEYTISGEVSAEAFEFETIGYKTSDCKSKCCVQKIFAGLDPTCSCHSESSKNANYALSLYNQFTMATGSGDLTTALTALRQLNRICEQGGCGC